MKSRNRRRKRRLRLRGRHAVAQAPNAECEIARILADTRNLRQNPYLRLSFNWNGNFKSRRHHAFYNSRRSSQRDHLSDDTWIRGKFSPPQCIADQNCAWSADFRFIRLKSSAKLGAHSQHGQNFG